MKQVHAIPITDISGRKRTLQICVGDITDVSGTDPVDMLVISCFPDDYMARPRAIVGQLWARGINVGELARNKAVDDC